MTSGASPLIGITADISDAPRKVDQVDQRIHLVSSGALFTAIERSRRASRCVLPLESVKAGVTPDDWTHWTVWSSAAATSIFIRATTANDPIKELGAIKARRTEFELEMAAAALERDVPILGICGGAQAINVVLGGSLYQDIATQLGRRRRPRAQRAQKRRRRPSSRS